MGDPQNITNQMLSDMAKKEGVDERELKKELLEMLTTDSLDTKFTEMFENASKAWGQPIAEAKNETRKLLAQQLKGK